VRGGELWAGSASTAEAADVTTYIDNTKLLEAFNKPGNLVDGGQYRVQTSRRVKPGGVEIHEKETDIFYVVDGKATLVTGGTAVEPRNTRPGQIAAKDITGGESREIKKGDVIVIPAGVPHWFKGVDGFVNYLVIKVIKP
jgi:mannose-6-phosphate isomerase-like protein (cupin superfamily)